MDIHYKFVLYVQRIKLILFLVIPNSLDITASTLFLPPINLAIAFKQDFSRNSGINGNYTERVFRYIQRMRIKACWKNGGILLACFDVAADLT